MRRIILFILPVLLLMSVLSDAQAAKKFKAPKEGGNLLIGRLIAGHQNNQRVYYGGINLMVVYEIEEDGEKKIKGRELSTDGDGYFRWENAPDAKYNLKGFRMPMGQRSAVIIISRLRSPRDQYIVQETANIIPMSGRKFLYEPNNRIIDMGNFIFHYSTYGAVTMNHGSTFESFELAGDQVEASYIQEYFLNPKKYKKSGWSPYLEESYIDAKSHSQIR